MNKFKVGDKVKVVKKVPYQQYWNNTWVSPQMDRKIGKEFVINHVNTHGVRLNTVLYEFPMDSLELIVETPQFEVGDRIKVIKKVAVQEGWRNSWVSDMDTAIDKVFIIDEISESGIRLDGLHYRFPSSALELDIETPVEDSPIAKSTVRYQYIHPTEDDIYCHPEFTGLCLGILTDIQKSDNMVKVFWSTTLKNPTDQFNKKIARDSLTTKSLNLLEVSLNFSRNEILSKILAELFYEERDLPIHYRKFVRRKLISYMNSIFHN